MPVPVATMMTGTAGSLGRIRILPVGPAECVEVVVARAHEVSGGEAIARAREASDEEWADGARGMLPARACRTGELCPVTKPQPCKDAPQAGNDGAQNSHPGDAPVMVISVPGSASQRKLEHTPFLTGSSACSSGHQYVARRTHSEAVLPSK